MIRSLNGLLNFWANIQSSRYETTMGSFFSQNAHFLCLSMIFQVSCMFRKRCRAFMKHASALLLVKILSKPNSCSTQFKLPETFEQPQTKSDSSLRSVPSPFKNHLNKSLRYSSPVTRLQCPKAAQTTNLSSARLLLSLSNRKVLIINYQKQQQNNSLKPLETQLKADQEWLLCVAILCGNLLLLIPFYPQ